MKFYAILLAALGLSTAALAHHSFAAEYDSTASIEVTGVVTKVEWTNPHAYVYLDVKDASGKVTNWAFEGYPPNTLRRVGFTRDMMKEGQTIHVTGWKARDNATRGAAREVTFPDGKKAFLGPAAN